MGCLERIRVGEPEWERVRVFCDGRQLEGCIEANSREGWALVWVNRRLVRVRGAVEIEENENERSDVG
jgi:hypothetical protein